MPKVIKLRRSAGWRLGRVIFVAYLLAPPLIWWKWDWLQASHPFQAGILTGVTWLVTLTMVALGWLALGSLRPGKGPYPFAAERPVDPHQRQVNQALYHCLAGAFKKAGWKHRCVPETQSIDFEFASEHGVIEGHARVRDKFGQLLVYSQPRNRLPDTFRPAMAEFLTQVNYALPIGNFELDFRDGLVRFKTSLTLGEDGSLPPSSMVVELLDMNIATMSLYLPGIQAVAAGQEPLKALALVEDVPEPKADFASRRVYLN